MKLVALAAALALGGPALAQDAQTTITTTTTTTTTASAPANTAPAAPPLGGYAPDTPFPNGGPAPGQQVVFVTNPQTASEAFPPPPALAHYPLCKRDQFDKCRQRGG